jgi:hypothetical protein
MRSCNCRGIDVFVGVGLAKQDLDAEAITRVRLATAGQMCKPAVDSPRI